MVQSRSLLNLYIFCCVLLIYNYHGSKQRKVLAFLEKFKTTRGYAKLICDFLLLQFYHCKFSRSLLTSWKEIPGHKLRLGSACGPYDRSGAHTCIWVPPLSCGPWWTPGIKSTLLEYSSMIETILVGIISGRRWT